jgi:hypothetical protein
MAQVPISEIKEMYGTVPEYLRANFGQGEYRVTIRNKGKATTQRVKIADDADSTHGNLWGSSGGAGGDGDPNLQAMLIQQQIEMERLKAEREYGGKENQGQLIAQLIALAEPFLGAFAQKIADGGGNQDVVSVIETATRSIKELSDVRNQLVGDTKGEGGGSELSAIMQGIAAVMQTMQNRASVPQPMPQPMAQPVPQPTPQFAGPSVSNVAPSVQPQPMTQPTPQPTSQPVSPPPSATPQPQEKDAMDIEEVFESVSTMIQEKQKPELVVDFLMNNIVNISDESLQGLEPEIGFLVTQMRTNPLVAWDVISQMVPALKDDQSYATEIRAEIEKKVSGVSTP